MTQINIYWVRHGYLCANYTRDHEKTWYNRFPHTFVKDPKLHTKGILDAQQLSQYLNLTEFDLICSSQLL
jgi:broad specificity phosphatase PhoE